MFFKPIPHILGMVPRTMSVWEKIYKAIAHRIVEEDRAFEIAYLRFGEARQWVVEQVGLKPNWLVLEIGYGQGYLSMELASVLKYGKVVGIDFLHENCTIGVTRWIAKQLGMQERIALVSSDSTKLPFNKSTFDAVVSFLALQDIVGTRKKRGVLATVDEACRVVKKGGIVAIADDSFAHCRPEGEQRMLFTAIKRYWHKLLPSEKELMKRMGRNGISDSRTLFYNPNESLLPKDAERELRLSVEWAKPFGIKVDFDNFWKEVDEVVRRNGRVYSKVALLLGRKTSS
jgi:ubiquinone/menaquinone biosynthesis C-methylase UbiE